VTLLFYQVTINEIKVVSPDFVVQTNDADTIVNNLSLSYSRLHKKQYDHLRKDVRTKGYSDFSIDNDDS
jgi:hypothetical protein